MWTPRYSEITLVQPRRYDFYAPIDQYRFKPHGRLRWLQRWLFNWLRGQGCLPNALDHTSYTKEVTINLDKLVDALMDNVENVYRLYERRAKYVIVGADKMRELLNVEPYYLEMRFPGQYEAPIRSGKVRVRNPYTGVFDREETVESRPGIERCFAGMPVIFVPWIKGIFTMPDPAEGSLW